MQQKMRISAYSINAYYIKTQGTLGKLLKPHACPCWIREHMQFPHVSHPIKRAASISTDKKLGTFCYFIISLFM